LRTGEFINNETIQKEKVNTNVPEGNKETKMNGELSNVKAVDALAEEEGIMNQQKDIKEEATQDSSHESPQMEEVNKLERITEEGKKGENSIKKHTKGKMSKLFKKQRERKAPICKALI